MANNGWLHDEKWDNEGVDPNPPKQTPGPRKVRVIKAEPQASSKGNPGAMLELLIIEDPPGTVATKEMKVRDWVYFTKDARWRTMQVSMAFGTKPTEGNSYEIVEQWCGDMLGREAVANFALKPDKNDPSRSFLNVSSYVLPDATPPTVTAGSHNRRRR